MSDPTPLSCARCATEFVPAKNQRYCSRVCQKKASRVKLDPATFQCETCGDPAERKGGRGPAPRWCERHRSQRRKAQLSAPDVLAAQRQRYADRPKVVAVYLAGVTKSCRVCQEDRPLSEFHRDPSKADGLHGQCKACCRVYDAAYAAERSDERRGRSRAYHRANRGAIRAMKARYRDANRELVRAASALANARRRAHLRALPSVPYAVEEIVARDGENCWVCTDPIDFDDRSVPRTWHIDHLIPVSASETYPNHPGDVLANVALTHHSCNLIKRARLLPEAVARHEANLRRTAKDGECAS